jgi:hypothetical protein
VIETVVRTIVETEIIEKVDAPVEAPIEAAIEAQPEEVKPEAEPVVEQPAEPVIEGESQPEQVFETVTEAPVVLIASEVDKLAPIEDISNIWPYETPHIASHPAIAELTQPAPTQHDNDSQSIWPQNLTIGSNIDFNEYSFDRTLERSEDYLDNDSFVVADAGLKEAPATTENVCRRRS